jgi:signal transduction histidine kinase
MRNPLNAILMTALHLAELNAGREISAAAARLIRGGASMQALLDDLTDFNRTQLGLGLKVAPQEMDLAEVAGDEIDQLRAAHPRRRIEFAASGDNRGLWDGTRVQQLLRNLVSNAIKHGAPDRPVLVDLRGEPSAALLEVSNSGRIDSSEIRELFDPLRKGRTDGESGEAREGLGLGLFIVREIARAHGGDVEACCEGERTTFAVRLPRQELSAVSADARGPERGPA